jgi:hypothetical protein
MTNLDKQHYWLSNFSSEMEVYNKSSELSFSFNKVMCAAAHKGHYKDCNNILK